MELIWVCGVVGMWGCGGVGWVGGCAESEERKCRRGGAENIVHHQLR